MPTAPSFDFYLTSAPTIPPGFKRLQSAPGTHIFQSPKYPTRLTLAVLHLFPDHRTRSATKTGVPKTVTIPANSMVQVRRTKDRENQQVYQISVVPGAATKQLWETWN